MIKWIKKLLFIIIAILLIALAVNMFLGPHKVAAGGITGLRYNSGRFIVFRQIYNNTYW